MGKGKDLTAKKMKIRLLREGMSTLEISKELCRDQTIARAVEDIVENLNQKEF